MNQLYQLFTGTPNESLAIAAQGIKVVVPITESFKCVEYGVASTANDPSGMVLSLQVVDAAGNTTTIDTLTVPVAATASDLISKRLDVHIDKLLNLYRVSLDGTPGTDVEDTDGIVKLQVNVTTGVDTATGTVYLKGALCGTASTATGQVLV